MSNRFDKLAKQIGQEALGPCGTTVVHDEINPETQYADLRHEPDPARQAERDRLGLLGRLAAVACLIEVYSQAPDGEELRACLTKHFAAWQQRVRKARSDNKKRHQPRAEDFVAPFLWIIAAGSPTTILSKLRLERSLAWPAGVYLFGDDILRVGIIVASELPRDSTTFLVRLMAAGPLLAPVVREMVELPPDAYERTVAEPILLQLQQTLGLSSSQDPDEQEFLMVMLKSWQETRTEGRAEGRAEGRTEGRTEGRAEGRAEGRTEGQAEAVLTVLRARGITVPDTARDRILAQRDFEQLKRWLERAATATVVEEVIDDPR